MSMITLDLPLKQHQVSKGSGWSGQLGWHYPPTPPRRLRLDTATVAEGSASTVVNVLTNDTDADGDTLTITAASYSGRHDHLLNELASYEPPSNFSGQTDYRDRHLHNIRRKRGTDTVTQLSL